MNPETDGPRSFMQTGWIRVSRFSLQCRGIGVQRWFGVKFRAEDWDKSKVGCFEMGLLASASHAGQLGSSTYPGFTKSETRNCRVSQVQG